MLPVPSLLQAWQVPPSRIKHKKDLKTITGACSNCRVACGPAQDGKEKQLLALSHCHCPTMPRFG